MIMMVRYMILHPPFKYLINDGFSTSTLLASIKHFP